MDEVPNQGVGKRYFPYASLTKNRKLVKMQLTRVLTNIKNTSLKPFNHYICTFERHIPSYKIFKGIGYS